MKKILGLGLVTLLVVVTAACSSEVEGSESAPDKTKEAEQPAETAKEPAVYKLKIDGMMCENCAKTVKDKLESIAGVVSADVSNTEGSATVTVKPGAKFDDAKAKELLDKDMFTLQSCEEQPAATN